MLVYEYSTVAYSIRTLGIATSSVIAVGLVGTAYILSGPFPFSTANATSTHELLVEYAAKDTDGDGLPDWEESLYGTDINNAHSVNPEVTDSEAVAKGLVKPRFQTADVSASTTPSENIPAIQAGPETVTDRFARTFFIEYLSKHPGTQPTPNEVASFVETNISRLRAGESTPDAFNAGQVRVVGTGSEALTLYAVTVEQTLSKKRPTANKSEVDYFADAVQRNDPGALAYVKQIAQVYVSIAKEYIAIPVPRELAAPHLAVANAFAHLGEDLTDMGYVDKDPLRAYLGLASYGKDSPLLVKTLFSIYGVYKAEQVTISETSPGFGFYRLLLAASRALAP